jgi:hypothetical protein
MRYKLWNNDRKTRELEYKTITDKNIIKTIPLVNKPGAVYSYNLLFLNKGTIKKNGRFVLAKVKDGNCALGIQRTDIPEDLAFVYPFDEPIEKTEDLCKRYNKKECNLADTAHKHYNETLAATDTMKEVIKRHEEEEEKKKLRRKELEKRRITGTLIVKDKATGKPTKSLNVTLIKEDEHVFDNGVKFVSSHKDLTTGGTSRRLMCYYFSYRGFITQVGLHSAINFNFSNQVEHVKKSCYRFVESFYDVVENMTHEVSKTVDKL